MWRRGLCFWILFCTLLLMLQGSWKRRARLWSFSRVHHRKWSQLESWLLVLSPFILRNWIILRLLSSDKRTNPLPHLAYNFSPSNPPQKSTQCLAFHAISKVHLERQKLLNLCHLPFSTPNNSRLSESHPSKIDQSLCLKIEQN